MIDEQKIDDPKIREQTIDDQTGTSLRLAYCTPPVPAHLLPSAIRD